MKKKIEIKSFKCCLMILTSNINTDYLMIIMKLINLNLLTHTDALLIFC